MPSSPRTFSTLVSMVIGTVAGSCNEVVRWERVRKYLSEFGVPTCGDGDFIPENIFYRLAMRAKNAAAEAFQAKIADEVIPSIRKHGAYITEDLLNKFLSDPESAIAIFTKLKEEREQRQALKD